MVDWRRMCVLCLASLATGCAGLKQFPDTATNFTLDLNAKDPTYASALEAMSQAGANAVAIRNRNDTKKFSG